MKWKRISKFSAFTLFELLLVMILISIIVTILGTTLYNVTGFHKRLKDRVDVVGSFKEFKYAINRDFNRMKYYEISGQKLIFTNGIDTVFYTFGENIVRQQSVRTDSMLVKGTLFFNDSITSIHLLLGERTTQVRLPSVSSGLLSYQSTSPETTDAPGTTEDITK